MARKSSARRRSRREEATSSLEESEMDAGEATNALFVYNEIQSKELRTMLSAVADENADGRISEFELLTAIREFHSTQKANKRLWLLVIGLVLIIILLLAANFGLSVAAAHLAKDSSVNNGDSGSQTSAMVTGRDGGSADGANVVRTGSISPATELEITTSTTGSRAARSAHEAVLLETCEHHVDPDLVGKNATYVHHFAFPLTGGLSAQLQDWRSLDDIPIAQTLDTDEQIVWKISIKKDYVVDRMIDVNTTHHVRIYQGITGDGMKEMRVCCLDGDCSFSFISPTSEPATARHAIPAELRHRSLEACHDVHDECYTHPIHHDEDGHYWVARRTSVVEEAIMGRVLYNSYSSWSYGGKACTENFECGYAPGARCESGKCALDFCWHDSSCYNFWGYPGNPDNGFPNVWQCDRGYSRRCILKGCRDGGGPGWWWYWDQYQGWYLYCNSFNGAGGWYVWY